MDDVGTMHERTVSYRIHTHSTDSKYADRLACNALRIMLTSTGGSKREPIYLRFLEEYV